MTPLRHSTNQIINMKNTSLKTYILLAFLAFQCALGLAQLSSNRLQEVADIKVERFQDILDLTPAQAKQLRAETIKLLRAQSEVIVNKDMIMQMSKNLEHYYASLTSLNSQQLSALKMLDNAERENRRETYREILDNFGHSSDFAVAVSAYNWNIVIPILVSYRKELDNHISKSDRQVIAKTRAKLLMKYELIEDLNDMAETTETDMVISAIQRDILQEIQTSDLPRLIKKYDDKIAQIRQAMSVHEQRIKRDVKSIYETHVTANFQNQIASEDELKNMLGIGKLFRDSFFLLMDGDSRQVSFDINALHLMTYNLKITDQF